LNLAAAKGQKEILILLLAKGARIGAVTYKGTNSLDLARQNGHIEIVKLLRDRGTAKWSASWVGSGGFASVRKKLFNWM
jgi:ankyrin repeat protein